MIVAMKKGVSNLGISGEIIMAHLVVIFVYMEEGVDCIQTSGTDSQHGNSSEHYKGDAIDYRTHVLQPGRLHPVADKIRARLSDEYDVVVEYEGTPQEHIHVEYDPKRPPR